MMGLLHINCWKDRLCHQRNMRKTSLEAETKYAMSTKSNKSTAIQQKVMRIVNLKAFRTPKVGLTGMATWIIYITAKKTVRETINPIWSEARGWTIRETQLSAMWVPHRVSPDWFSLHGGPKTWLKSCWWRSIQLKRRGLRETKQSRTECVNVFSAGFLCCLTENVIERNIMGYYRTVACEQWLINRSIAGKMNDFARCINFNRMRVSSARLLLGLALAKAESRSCRQASDISKLLWTQLSMAADVEWTIHHNEHQRSVNNYWSCNHRNWIVICLLLCLTNSLAASIGGRASGTVTAPFW